MKTYIKSVLGSMLTIAALGLAPAVFAAEEGPKPIPNHGSIYGAAVDAELQAKLQRRLEKMRETSGTVTAPNAGAKQAAKPTAAKPTIAAPKPATNQPKPSAPAGSTVKTPEQDIKERHAQEQDAKERSAITDTLWGTTDDAMTIKGLWQDLQKLLVDHQHGGWEESNWTQVPYDRLAELRDEVMPGIHESFEMVLPYYIDAYDQLPAGSSARQRCLTLVNAAASALFGMIEYTPEQYIVVTKIIAEVKKLSPLLANAMHELVGAKKVFGSYAVSAPTAKPAPKPSAKPVAQPAPKKDAEQKKDADVKAQKDTGKIKKFKNLEELQQHYKNELRKEEQGLMEIMYSYNAIIEQQWNDMLKLSHLFQSLVPSRRTKYSPNSKLYKMAVSILKQSGVDPATVNIVHDDGNKIGILAASVTEIIMNEQACENMAEDAFNACLLHEIQHRHHEDTIILPCMAAVMKKYPEFLTLWNHFIEKRADISALIVNPAYTKGFIEYFQNLNPAHQFKECCSHPSNANRVALAQQIYTEMMACLQA